MIELVEVKTAELSGAVLDWAVMVADGFRLVRVGYLGMHGEGWCDETPEQIGMPEWFAAKTNGSVGAYWVKDEGEQVFHALWPNYTDPLMHKPRSPSSKWAHGGPLIDLYDPDERRLPDRSRIAEVWLDLPNGDANAGVGIGPTRLIAVCRAIVASVMGDTVSVPRELLG